MELPKTCSCLVGKPTNVTLLIENAALQNKIIEKQRRYILILENRIKHLESKNNKQL